jgi:hypothetical protein
MLPVLAPELSSIVYLMLAHGLLSRLVSLSQVTKTLPELNRVDEKSRGFSLGKDGPISSSLDAVFVVES